MTTPTRAGVVSTIITAYNRPVLLAEAVASVLGQSYRPIEIVIVDDGSTDHTGAVGAGLAASHPDLVRYIRQENRGPAAASNAGLRVVTGEFIQFLDSDDLLAPQKFTQQVAGLRASPECGISYCQTQEYVMGDRPSGVPSRRTGQALERLFPALVSGRVWPSPSPLYRRAVIDANGFFVDSSIYQDWEYECRAAARRVRLHYCPAVLADVRHTHHLEGREKGSVTGERLRDYAGVLELMFHHTVHPDVSTRDRDGLAGRLFAAARQCGAGGYPAEARRCLDLALAASGSRRSRRIRWFAVLVSLVGWPRADDWCARAGRSSVLASWRVTRRQPAALMALWRHRAAEAAHTIAGQPLARWPALLWERWTHRRSRVGAKA